MQLLQGFKMDKKLFLVVYDYGMGGVWSLIYASDAEEIKNKYPQLQVIEKRPTWMDDVEYLKISKSNTFDIDKPEGWLLTLSHE